MLYKNHRSKYNSPKNALVYESYYVKIDETHKECFELYLNGKRYYAKDSDSLNHCYEKCHSSVQYHQKDDSKCLEKYQPKLENEATEECISSCGISNRFWIKETIESKGITIS